MPTAEIADTCAASSTPLSASSVTVAAWPTLTLLMSDSLNATVIVSLYVLMISAKLEVELLDDELEEPLLPRLPAVVPPELLVELLEDKPALDEAELVPEETESPGERLASETIVPLSGA